MAQVFHLAVLHMGKAQQVVTCVAASSSSSATTTGQLMECGSEGCVTGG